MRLIATNVDIVLNHVRAFLNRLDLPSRDEYVAAAAAAIRDVRAASSSSWNLAYISFRPIFILLGILSHYLAIVLRVIAKHSVAHGWIAAREGYFQLRTATIWFVKFQRDLPLTAKCAELGAVAVLVTLWLLRRHVKKHRYVERTVAWYTRKKRRALRSYNNFVDRVAKTSSFLALLLPHLLYLILVAGTKRIVPSVVTYLATRTYLCSIISFWHPLYLTFSVLGRLSRRLKAFKEEREADKSGKKTPGNSRGKIMTPSRLKQQQQQEAEIEGLRADVVELLKYWVVYAILLAIVRTGKLLPFIGHVLNATPTDTAQATGSKGFFAKKSGLYAKLRLPGEVVVQISLIFFVWLRLMPSPASRDEVNEKRRKQSELKPSGSRHLDKSGPVDILYSKLSPFVLSAMSSSALMAKRALGENRKEGSSFASVVIQKLQSVLDLFVLVRLISKDSKEWLITTIIESSALLPAVTTLLMPSYFTSFGVIYVSLVVPAGYSTASCNAIMTCTSKHQTMMPEIDDASRYLQFWVVHAAVSILLESFAPVLAWIPLSTHATWLLWAWIQLESSTRKLYGWVEGELGKKSLDDTAVVRSTRRIIAALPSNIDDKAHEPEGEKRKVA